MRICVVGAGAIGGMLAAAFARAGHRVSLVARGAHLEALQARGLEVHWLDGSVQSERLPASAEPADLGPQDAVLLSLKGYSVGAMLPRIAPLLEPHTPVVTVLNGLPWWYFQRLEGRFAGERIECLDPEGRLAAALDARHIVGCVAHTAGERVSPGVIRHTSGRRYIMGEIDGSESERVRALCAALSAGGCEGLSSQVIRNDIWMKLIGNLSYNPVAALTLARMHQINAQPGLIRLIRALMQEAMQVAAAYGEPVSLSIDERLEIARAIGTSKNSMHQDLERGRPLEIDGILGSVHELAGKAGIAVPMLDAMLALISERARH